MNEPQPGATPADTAGSPAPDSASSTVSGIDQTSSPGDPPRLARSAGLTGIATLASRILGLTRDQVLAGIFGAGNDMDAFLVAFRIPNLVRDLFAEGAMSAAFVPTFTRHLTLNGRRDAWRLGTNVINALLLVTGLLVLLGLVFTEPLVTAFASDYGHVPGKLELTVQLTRVMLPFLCLVALAAAAMGMLNSLHHYFLPALSPAMFNVATIVCAFALVPVMPYFGLPRIMAIAVATLIGGLGQVALQWPSLRREGFRYRLHLDPRDPGLHQVMLLMGPGTIGLAAVQINLLVNTVLATSQGTGAVSWLNYAFRLMYLPIGLFGVSIATAVLPAVSRHAARQDTPAIRATVAGGIGMMMMVNVPATAGLIALAPSIVQLLFEHGRFAAADTVATAAAVRFYAVGLVGYSAVRIASPTFYALGQSRVPVIVSAVAVAVNVVLNLLLVRIMGYRGLALGTSITAVLNAVILLILLRRRLDGLESGRLASGFLRISVAAAAMALVAVALDGWLSGLLPGRGIALQAIRLGATIGGALITLALAARLLRIPEFDDALRAVTSRVAVWRKAR